MDPRAPRIQVGIDTGGTFTDFSCREPGGRWRRWKLLSTPADPSRAIMEGLDALFPGLDPAALELVHGTTVGTNAFLERKGARTVLLTTKGFEDVLWIGRQARPSLYDFMVTRPPEIIPRHRVLGIGERMTWKGEAVEPLDPKAVAEALAFCRRKGAESVAVCLLHAYANAAHEQALFQGLSGLGVPVSLSSRVLPEFREFERFSTTLINAYLGPLVGRYVDRLEAALPGARLFIQQSNGGCHPARGIGLRAVHTLLSGPAAGVEAAWRLARNLGFDQAITFDMGGTSTDVSLCAGGLGYTQDYRIDGYPVAIPILDIHTVGAGGGSLAWIDAGGLLRVGPGSAGADPGPVCYGKGRGLTVTDANLFLGRLRPEAFLGGRMRLHPERVGRHLEALGVRLGLSARDTALGIVRLVNTSMVQAIRSVSLERGYDPRLFPLICFGGAAGLHAAEVADELGIRRVIFPGRAGVFSAEGMADADLLFDLSQTRLFSRAREAHGEIGEAVEALSRKMRGQLEALEVSQESLTLEPSVDVRYRGQSFELTVPWSNGWPDAFAEAHRRLYGYDLPDKDLEVMGIRLQGRIPRGEEAEPREDAGSSGEAFQGPGPGRRRVPIIFGDGQREATLLYKKEVESQTRLCGPLLVLDEFSTILVPQGWALRGGAAHLLLERD